MADELQRILDALEHLRAGVEDLRQDMRTNTEQVTDLRLWRAKMEGVLAAAHVGVPLVARVAIPVVSAASGALLTIIVGGSIIP